jgi:hypothetical protein
VNTKKKDKTSIESKAKVTKTILKNRCVYIKRYFCRASYWRDPADCSFYDGFVSPTDNKVHRGAKCNYAHQEGWGFFCENPKAIKGSKEYKPEKKDD